MARAPQPQRRPPRDEVRRRLLTAATSVFAQRGIDGASLADVAVAAGLTKGAIYSNFTGKDDLVYALMDAHISAREALAVAALEAGTGPAPVTAARIGDVLAGALAADADWQRLFLEFWSHAQRDEHLRAAFAARRADARERLAQLIRRESETRDLRLALAPDELATLLLALSNGLAIERLTDPESVPDALFGRVLALLLAGSPADG